MIQLPSSLEAGALWPLAPHQSPGKRSWGPRPHLPSFLSHPAVPQFRCMPPTPADMIFLVDGSWSIGHSHFQQIKDFLASVIEPFEIGPDKVQVGGCQSCPAPQPWRASQLTSPCSGRSRGAIRRRAAPGEAGWASPPGLMG